MSEPICPYCGKMAVLVTAGMEGYPYNAVPHFMPERDYGPIWRCMQDAAWVGCHRGTTTPLGRLANATLRRRKMEAHAAFDHIWKSRYMSRSDAYRWLKDALGSIQPVHIGEMDVDDCRRVVEVCKLAGFKATGKRA